MQVATEGVLGKEKTPLHFFHSFRYDTSERGKKGFAGQDGPWYGGPHQFVVSCRWPNH